MTSSESDSCVDDKTNSSSSFTNTMSQQGAALQNYNNELVKCIEDLCAKRDELQRVILTEEEGQTQIRK